MEIAKLIENEDGVTAAVDAFHRPPTFPATTANSITSGRGPCKTYTVVFLHSARWCCLPCGGV